MDMEDWDKEMKLKDKDVEKRTFQKGVRFIFSRIFFFAACILIFFHQIGFSKSS